MKKVILMVFFMLTFSFLAACSAEGESKEKNEETSENIEEANKEKDESVAVDKGLMNVEVTLPASMLEGENIEDLKDKAEEKGIKEVTQHEDGTVTYKMSKSTHKELMNELETSLKDTIKETKNSEDYISIKDITHNHDFSAFTMVVNQSDYENSMDGFAALTLGIAGMMYQLYDGADTDKYSVTITVEDEGTGETIDEVVYPDALEDTETE
ncbi:hypothetical protein [Halobacillus sp. Marseille-Q1614]|uniref:hypothetical protein n=1 Tax=Halobacillus sp. Marseille-Q1614 TaxID=2709134 RepID=UPI00156FD494|nr:hypothetical protein [Halobacillus sp. Marseille-Q1614]